MDMTKYLRAKLAASEATCVALDEERRLMADHWGPHAWMGFAKRLRRAQDARHRCHDKLTAHIEYLCAQGRHAEAERAAGIGI